MSHHITDVRALIRSMRTHMAMSVRVWVPHTHHAMAHLHNEAICGCTMRMPACHAAALCTLGARRNND